MGSRPQYEDDYTRIFVRDMSIDMFIGVNDFEKVGKQRVMVSVTADIVPNDERHDDIRHTVSYDILSTHIKHMANQPHVNLVETLAERIASACLNEHGIQRVTVSIEKPDIYDNGVPGVMIARTK